MDARVAVRTDKQKIARNDTLFVGIENVILIRSHLGTAQKNIVDFKLTSSKKLSSATRS